MAGVNYHDPLPHLRTRRVTGAGLRRLTATCCERAAAAIEGGADDAAVHLARRCLKRTRALLWLAQWLGVRGALGVRRRLGTRARALGPLRDEAVARVAAAKAGIAWRAGPAPGRRRESWSGWSRGIRRELRLIEHLRWPDPAQKALHAALGHGVRRVCRRARQVRWSDLGTVHAWRKAVIVVREQLTALDGALADRRRRASGALVKLAHLLGQALDRQVLLAADKDVALSQPIARRIRREQRRCLQRARSRWPKLRRRLRRAL